MKINISQIMLVGLLLTCFGFVPDPAVAQATRTWVSGVGDDAQPCSRTAPCKTFAGAISKTQAGGEIDCLDPGGFGAVTITKAITIDCTGTHGSVLVSGTNAIVVSAGASDKVTLRGLSINGIGTGLAGIRFLGGAQLNVEQCVVFGFTGNGIDISTGAFGIVNITNTYVTGVNKGIVATSTAGVQVIVNNTSILHPGVNGFEAQTDVVAVLTNTTITAASGFAVVASGRSNINIDNSTLATSVTAIGATECRHDRAMPGHCTDDRIETARPVLCCARHRPRGNRIGLTIKPCAPPLRVAIQGRNGEPGVRDGVRH
jgi:hypothetical protein